MLLGLESPHTLGPCLLLHAGGGSKETQYLITHKS